MTTDLSFAQFMDQALFDVDKGFYAKAQRLDSHFVTAPMLTKAFGATLAQDWLTHHEDCLMAGITEWGPGQGDLLFAIMGHLAACDRLPPTYVCVERSQALRLALEARLDREQPLWRDRVIMAENPKPLGILVANELLDAMPAERFRFSQGVFWQQRLRWQEDHYQVYYVPAEGELLAYCQALGSLPEGYVSEAPLVACHWWQQQLSKLERGLCVIIDYGYLQDEYYHAERRDGTLAVFKDHQRLQDPFSQSGPKDISVHVQFSALIDCLREDDQWRLQTQAQYLCRAGFLHQLDSENWNEILSAKTLLLPGSMGDVVKVFEVRR